MLKQQTCSVTWHVLVVVLAPLVAREVDVSVIQGLVGQVASVTTGVGDVLVVHHLEGLVEDLAVLVHHLVGLVVLVEDLAVLILAAQAVLVGQDLAALVALGIWATPVGQVDLEAALVVQTVAVVLAILVQGALVMLSLVVLDQAVLGASEMIESSDPTQITFYNHYSSRSALVEVCCVHYMKATKWSQRKEAVAELTKLASTKRIAPGDFTDVKTATKNKVPLVRSLTLNWVTYCIETSNKAVILKVHKEYVPICMEPVQFVVCDVLKTWRTS